MGVSRISPGLLLTLALLITRLAAWWARPLHEQGWLHLRIGGHFADGLGLRFNPGEPWEPVWSSLAPLWSAGVGAALSSGAEPRGALLALQLCCECAVLWGLARLLADRPRVCFLAQACYVCLPQLARSGVGGSEASLGLALSLHALAGVRSDREGWLRGSSAGLLAGLALLVRPEALLLACFGRTRRFFLGFAAAALPAVLVFLTQGPLPPLEPVWQSEHVLAVLRRSFLPHDWLLPLLPLVLWGVRVAWREPGCFGARALLTCALGTLCAQAAFPHPLYSWNLALVWTAWCVALAFGTEAWRPLNERRQRALLAGGVLVLFVLAVLTRSPVHERVHAPLIRWAESQSRLEPRARVLASDIGALGFGWRGAVLASEGWLWPPAHRLEAVNNMLREAQPEYLLLSCERDRLLALQSDAWVLEHYQPVRRFSPEGSEELSPDPEQLPSTHHSDYLLFRRR